MLYIIEKIYYLKKMIPSQFKSPDLDFQTFLYILKGYLSGFCYKIFMGNRNFGRLPRILKYKPNKLVFQGLCKLYTIFFSDIYCIYFLSLFFFSLEQTNQIKKLKFHDNQKNSKTSKRWRRWRS